MNREDSTSTFAQYRHDDSSQAKWLAESFTLYRALVPSLSLRILIYVGLWLAVAAASALHWWFYPQGDYPYTWWELLGVKAAVWYTWALLVPLILCLGARFRLDSLQRWRRLSILFLAGAALTLAYLLLYTQWILWLTNQQPQPARFGPMLSFVISRHSTYYFLAFWVVISVEHIVAYYQRYLQREKLAAQLQAQLAQAQLMRLKSQLQPHFLFNALNTVSSLVLSGKKSEAYDTLADLAELLRISLDRNESEFVSLAEELEFSRLYVQVMSRRFPDRLHILWEVGPESLDAAVPNMILQPLIENAIKYGVTADLEFCSVTLIAKTVEGGLSVSLSNPVGRESTTSATQGHGLGISQIRQRLIHHYASEHQFEIDTDGGQFNVRIVIPYNQLQTARGIDKQEHDPVARRYRR